MVNIKQIVWEPIKYLVSKVGAHFQNNGRRLISFTQVSKQRNCKNIKKTRLKSRI